MSEKIKISRRIYPSDEKEKMIKTLLLTDDLNKQINSGWLTYVNITFFELSNTFNFWFFENLLNDDGSTVDYELSLDDLKDIKQRIEKVLPLENDSYKFSKKEIKILNNSFAVEDEEYDKYYFEELKDFLVVVEEMIFELENSNIWSNGFFINYY